MPRRRDGCGRAAAALSHLHDHLRRFRQWASAIIAAGIGAIRPMIAAAAGQFYLPMLRCQTVEIAAATWYDFATGRKSTAATGRVVKLLACRRRRSAFITSASMIPSLPPGLHHGWRLCRVAAMAQADDDAAPRPRVKMLRCPALALPAVYAGWWAFRRRILSRAAAGRTARSRLMISGGSANFSKSPPLITTQEVLAAVATETMPSSSRPRLSSGDAARRHLLTSAGRKSVRWQDRGRWLALLVGDYHATARPRLAADERAQAAAAITSREGFAARHDAAPARPRRRCCCQ